MTLPYTVRVHLLTPSKPGRRSITAAKRKPKEKNGKKNTSRVKKPKAVGHFLIQPVRQSQIVQSAFDSSGKVVT